jgi:uncharacterized phosphosugar-binding protein
MAEGTYFAAARDLLDRVEAQDQALEEAAEICVRAIGDGGFVHAFGTGHSRIAVEELFPRYGSFPGFNPIAELSMTFHTQVAGANGQRQAMFIERVEGLADRILANFNFGESDAMLVISATGTSAVPIEMAIGAHERRLPVVAITSVAASEASSASHSSGTRLLDHADVVLDLCTPPGDGLMRLEGREETIAPGSTVAGAALVNELKFRVATALAAAGKLPPIITSPSLVGADRAEELFEAAYDEHARRLARALTRPESDEAGERR